jgi:hypothetical protein
MRRTLCALVTVLLSASGAQAAPVTWELTGSIVVLGVNQQAAYPFALGDAFTWDLTWDPAAPDLAPDPCGVYTPITAMSLDAGAVHLTQANPGQAFVVTPATGFTGCANFSPAGANTARLLVGFGPLVLSQHFLAGPTDALPTILQPFGTLDFLLAGNPLANGVVQRARAVPEPGSVLLLGGIVAWMRRRR